MTVTLPQMRFVFADQGESATTVRHYLQVQGAQPAQRAGRQQPAAFHALCRARLSHHAVLGRQRPLRDIHVGELSRATLTDALEGTAAEHPR